MIKHLILIFSLISITSQAQEFVWAKSFGGSGAENQGAVAATPDGGFIYFGTFSSTVVVGDSTYSTGSLFQFDYVLYKMDAYGEVLWSKHYGGFGNDQARDVTVDQTTGNIYVTGTTSGNPSFGSLALPITSSTSPILVCFNAQGVAQWGHVFTGGYNYADEVIVDNSGNVLVSGWFGQQISIGTTTHVQYSSSGPVRAPYVAKFNANGVYQWSQGFPMSALSVLLGPDAIGFFAPIAVKSNNDVIIGLNVVANVVVGNDTLTAPNPNTGDLLMLTMNPSGVGLDSTWHSGPSRLFCHDIVVDDNDHVFFTGETGHNETIVGHTTVVNTSRSGFLAEVVGTGGNLSYTSDGNVQGGFLDVDTSGNIYVSGNYNNQLVWGGHTLPSSGNNTRGFIGKFNPAASNWEWFFNSSPTVTTSSQEYFSRVTVSAEDNVLFCGKFDATAKFGDDLFNASGSFDALIVHIANCSQLNAVLNSSVASQCSATSAQLSSPFSSALNYQWYGNGTSISGATSNTYSAISQGDYFVIVDSLGCTDTSNVFTLDSSGLGLTVTLNNFSPICANSSPFTLIGGAPGGGVYSGLGVSNGTFDPSINGGGNYTIKYVYTDTNTGCLDSASKSILVNSVPSVVVLPLDSVCIDDSPIILTNGYPTGGVYSGTGVSSGVFNPTAAGLGTHMIYYSKSNTNCTTTDSTTIKVLGNPNASFSMSSSVCNNASALALSGTPSGGTFSGTGVSGSFFIPQILSPGEFVVTYNYSANGCTVSVSDTTLVDSLPSAVLAPITAMCEDASPLDLAALANTTAGYFSGTGMSGSVFDPSVAGAGSHQILFIASNSCGNDTASQIIAVNALPTVSIGALPEFCLDASSMALLAGSPSGGVYAGAGITSGVFDPVAAGVGIHGVSYTFTDANGCINSDTASITVNALPVASLGQVGPYCVNVSSAGLNNGSPSGGVYSGTGVSGNNFQPSTAGVGFHTLTYTYTDGNGCADTTSTQVDVRIIFEDTVQHVACDSFTSVLGETYYASGTYVDSLQSIGNCDSVVVREVTINHSTFEVQNAATCYAYISPSGNNYMASGIYQDTLTTISGCDSVIQTNLIINDTTYGGISPVVCDAYLSPLGATYTASGVYIETLSNANGCDSVLSINLTVNESDLDTLVVSACDSYISPGGHLLTTSTVFYDTLSNGFSCDSIVRLELTINNSSSDTVITTSCDSYTSTGGVAYSVTGVYPENYLSIHGCDSVVVEDVTILSASASSLAPVVCDLYISPVGNTYTISGLYSDTITATNGCDSVITINLIVNESDLDTLVVEACDTYTSVGGHVLTSSTVHYDTLSNASGCDSIVRLELTVNNSSNDTVMATMCDSYTSVGGVTYTLTGVYTENYLSINGCDSIVVEDVTILPSSASTLSPVACDSYLSPAGNTYTTSGLYADTLAASNGCDSIIAINLTVNLQFNDTVYETSCDSFFVSAANQWVYSTGFTTAILNTVNGCDSAVTVHVTVNPSYAITISEVSCDSFTSASGTVYYGSTSFTETLSTVSGCDSLVTVNLTVNHSTSDTLSVVSCDSFLSSQTTYYSSGFHLENYVNQSGCDSLVTYDLVINSSEANTFTEVTCDSFVSPSNTVYTSSGLYDETLTTVNGCDSLVTYAVTVYEAVSTSDTVESCGSYTSPLGQTYNVSGAYFDTTTASTGCDSILLYLVTVYPEFNTSVTVDACELYLSPLGQVYTASGTYVDTTSSSSGCDSVITYLVTIHQTEMVNLTISSCGEYQSSWGSVYSESGSYVDTISSSFGCDSIIILDLTVKTVDTMVVKSGSELIAQADPSETSYQWLKCSDTYQPISGETNQTFTPTSSGEYAVQVTQNGCSDTSACRFVQSVGIEGVNIFHDLNLYPNPTRGVLIVDLGQSMDASFEIRNLLGELVLVKQVREERRVELTLDQPKGIYIVQVRSGKGQRIERVVVE